MDVSDPLLINRDITRTFANLDTPFSMQSVGLDHTKARSVLMGTTPCNKLTPKDPKIPGKIYGIPKQQNETYIRVTGVIIVFQEASFKEELAKEGSAMEEQIKKALDKQQVEHEVSNWKNINTCIVFFYFTIHSY